MPSKSINSKRMFAEFHLEQNAALIATGDGQGDDDQREIEKETASGVQQQSSVQEQESSGPKEDSVEDVLFKKIKVD